MNFHCIGVVYKTIQMMGILNALLCGYDALILFRFRGFRKFYRFRGFLEFREFLI